MITNLKQSIIGEKEEKHAFNKRRFRFTDDADFAAVERSTKVTEWEFFDVLANFPFLQERVFSHVSNRLLQKYQYWNDKGELRLTHFFDLLVQAREICVKSRESEGYPPSLLTGVVVFPNDMRDEIVIAPNDCGKLTIKLNTDA